MAGLKDRFITIRFPELTEDGQPELYVTIRNPKLVPLDWLTSKLATGTNGQPLDADAALWENYERLARLVTDLRMYDAEDLGEDQGLLEMPITADKLRKFPTAVNTRIAEELGRVGESPTTTPDSLMS